MKHMLVSGIIALLVGAACWAMQGPLPGDVAIAQMLQSAFGPQPPWAFALTTSAVLPAALLTVAAGALLAWWLRGWGGAAAAMIAYGLALAADKALRAGIFVERPAEPLVAVVAPSASSGLPSTFGLVYGAVFGIALLAKASQGRAALPPRLIALAAIVMGAGARVVLGGHWPSQMVASLAAGLMLAALAIALSTRMISWFAGTRV